MVTVRRVSSAKASADFRLSREILPMLAPHLAVSLLGLPENIKSAAEEIRLRSGKPLTLRCGSEEVSVTPEGKVTSELSLGLVVSQEQVLSSLEIMTQSSVYAWQEEIKHGFITLRGGHRVGLAGKVLIEGSAIKTIKYVSSLNIRISRQVKGIGQKVLPYLVDKGVLHNTLVISPPQAGKTTLLRDISRLLSCGLPEVGIKGFNVGVVDERSELAGCWDGIPQNDLGPRTDVLDCCPKSLGMIMLLRSMSPQVIVTDELGRPEDLTALEEAVNGGVAVITTVHGKDEIDVNRKPLLGRVLESGVFGRIVVLSRRLGVGTVEKILDMEKGYNLTRPFTVFHTGGAIE